MAEAISLHINVAGAGVFGLSIALELARRGARVTLADPAPAGPNASSVAAGMLAPALEAALDPLLHGRYRLLEQSRDLWPAVVEDLEGVVLHRDGALFRGSEADLETVFARLTAEGAAVEVREGAVFTPDDWRIEPRRALAAMRRRFTELGGEVVSGVVQDLPPAGATVLACGYQALDLAPELSALTPIRGQLLRFRGGPKAGPILRMAGGYLAPGEDGAVVGATMEAGRTDLPADPGATQRLMAAAVELAPELAGAPHQAQVGIRAAASDGLPLVGRSLIEGVWIAAGARRNGWLLAPLVAQIIADGLLGGGGHAEAAAQLDCGRFRSNGGEEPSPPG